VPGETGKTWNFDGDKPDAPPIGLSFARTGQGPQGKWLAKAVPDAPSRGNVLAQTDADDTDYRFPVAKDDTFADAGKVGVWTKADSIIYFDDLTAEAL